MSKPTADIASAEARVAASREDIVVQVDALKLRVRRLVSSPYLLAGLAAAGAATAYFLVTRSSQRRAKSPSPAARTGLASVLTTAQILQPWLAGLAGAAIAARRRRDTPAAVAPQAPGLAPKSLPPPPRGSWLTQQGKLFGSALQAWIDDYAPSMGAALAYYTLFSLAPLLLIVIAVAGMVFGQQAAQGEIVAQLSAIMGEEGAVAVQGLLKAAREPAKGLMATLIGIAMLLLGATAIFAELQSALDRIWRVPAPKAESGLWYLLRTRLLSFGLVLGLGFLLVVSLVVSAALAALGKWWGVWFQGWDVFFELLNFGVSYAIFTLLFAMIYKIMPRATVSWRDVWTGAAVTALLFTLGKVLIGLYLGRSSLASGFGAAGSLVVLIAWVYYSAQIFLFGAEYTWVYANRYGSRARQTAPSGLLTAPAER